MSRQGDLMRRSLKRILLPELKKLGFDGERSSFRRTTEVTLDLLEIQYWKYGGELILEFIRLPRGELVRSYDIIPEELITLPHTPPDLRARLEERRIISASGYRGFVFSGFGEDAIQYDNLAEYIVTLLPQVELWLEQKISGPNIGAF